MSDNASTAARKSGVQARSIAYGLRILALAAFVIFTNDGFLSRVMLLHDQGRLITLAGFIGMWGLSLVALLIAAFQSSVLVRCFWALIIAVTTAAGFAYRHASGSELGIFDALSLWNARHEAARAAAFYASDFYWFIAISLIGFVIFAIPPAPAGKIKLWLTRLMWVPAFPIVAIAGIILFKEGGGSEVLPAQFTPLSVSAVAISEAAANPMPGHRAVTLAPHSTPIQHVIMLVDESVRGDYIDWTPGNPYTPVLASLKSKIVNFGPASSGGNCSHYSNAILRFGASRASLGHTVMTNPTIWQYAKKAGFRTVYIDAQAAFNRNPGKLQNFMTAAETQDIDSFHALDENIPAPELDDKLLDIVLKALKSDKPVFVYANKNGAHFPYDNGYPPSATVFRPTMTESDKDTMQTRINSFRNVVRWSVDRFFKRLFEEAELKNTVIIYTSDHGQNFNPARLSHCTVDDPDPREGLVPLFVITDNDGLRARFAAAAEASRGHASHFSIAPTVLQLLGYSSGEVEKIYGESLLEKNARPPAFTSGDIFGLFSSKVRWHPLDLSRNYLEPAARPQPSAPAHVSMRDKQSAASAVK